jgi:hypothetical protein
MAKLPIAVLGIDQNVTASGSPSESGSLGGVTAKPGFAGEGGVPAFCRMGRRESLFRGICLDGMYRLALL